jgi:hypothetical protein
MPFKKATWIIIILLILGLIAIISYRGLTKGSAYKKWSPRITNATITYSKDTSNGHIQVKSSGTMQITHPLINNSEPQSFNITEDEVMMVFDYIINQEKFYSIDPERGEYNKYASAPPSKIIVTNLGKSYEIYLHSTSQDLIFNRIKDKILDVASEYIDLKTFQKYPNLYPP